MTLLEIAKRLSSEFPGEMTIFSGRALSTGPANAATLKAEISLFHQPTQTTCNGDDLEDCIAQVHRARARQANMELTV